VLNRDRHLTEEEIDVLLGIAPPNVGPLPTDKTQSDEWDRHVSECEACRKRAILQASNRSKLAMLKIFPEDAPGKSCPELEEWTKLAVGVGTPDRIQEMLAHAAVCGHCGPMLKTTIHDFSDSISPAEAALLSRLESSKPAWQARLASRLTGDLQTATVRVGSPFRAKPALWRWAAVSAVALLIATGWFWFLRPQTRIQGLLARAYTERRTLEPRMPGAKYAPVRIERGAGVSHLDSPPALLDAEKEIAVNLAKHPSDPFWLQSRARAELLEGNYEGAIPPLRQALSFNQDSSSLLIDLATAYSQRAESNGTTEDFGEAINLLGRALKTSPNDPVATFNRALISRKALLFSQSIEDWRRYLEIDPKGEWANEARSRLEETIREQQKRKTGRAHPLLTPEQFADLSFDDPASIDTADQKIEAYGTAALLEWVQAAFSPNAPRPSDVQTTRRAFAALGRLFLDRHADPWWSDLMVASSSPYFPQALAHLSTAIEANESGNTAVAHANATQAINLFRIMGTNEAGILRASTEDLYASNIDQNATNCIQADNRLRNFARLKRYPWLNSEFHIQEGNCFWLKGDLGLALAAYSTAEKEAAAANYGTILLGAQDHWSMAAGASGDSAGAWRKSAQGLQQFWDGDFADVRGYNFYYSLYELARMRKMPFLELSIWKDAIPLTESSHDLAQVAVAHTLYANSALATDNSLLAVQELEKASQLFAEAPQIPSTRMAYLEAQTRLAGVEARMGKAQNSLARLKPMEFEVGNLDDNYLKVLFYDCFGRALLDNGEFADGERALRSAVGLAEFQLQSIDSFEARAQWKINTSETYKDLASLLAHNGDEEGSFELWESFRAAPVRQLRTQTSPVPVRAEEANSPQISSYLHDLTAATTISYALLPTELLTWTADNRGVTLRQARVSSTTLVSDVDRFRNLCANPDSDPQLLRSQARHLYDVLVAPVEKQFETGRTLIFELDDPLSQLPLEALIDAQNHFLSDRAPILSSPGIVYGESSKGGIHITRNTAALVVAVSTSSEGSTRSLSPLPDVGPEAEAVAGEFHSPNLLTGRVATLNEVLSRIPGAVVFHFAGHSSDSSAMPGLLLSDSKLTTRNLDGINLSGMRLAVLSACDTSDVDRESFNNSRGLTDYFLSVGVPRVVASRWNVDSATTQEFMQIFYGGLLRGATVEQSLRAAQAQMRRVQNHTHPFFWAAFTTFGSGSLAP